MAKTNELLPVTGQRSVAKPQNRFTRHPIYRDPETGNIFVGSWNPPTFPYKETDKSFQITQEFAYRPDAISFQYYGTPLFAWILAYVNDIVNPWDREKGFYPGRIIRIPDLTTINSVLVF